MKLKLFFMKRSFDTHDSHGVYVVADDIDDAVRLWRASDQTSIKDPGYVWCLTEDVLVELNR